jgi:hypothetical protein
MNLRAVLAAVAVYTGLAGAATVAGVYYSTHSGLFILVTGAVGLLLVVLGAADSSAVPTTNPAVGMGEVSTEEMGLQDLPVSPTLGTQNTYLVLVAYGVGLFLWSGVAVAFFRSGLH